MTTAIEQLTMATAQLVVLQREYIKGPPPSDFVLGMRKGYAEVIAMQLGYDIFPSRKYEAAVEAVLCFTNNESTLDRMPVGLDGRKQQVIRMRKYVRAFVHEFTEVAV